ncbi:type IV secretion system DNA-binding domain-containing protein [Aggregatilinea lenta]|uniref:type IV secretion system DNA-binding domain-containing protein n=1 Tax=Aggregatilinea lenta TaxID=913108 RepID=UPI000E5C1D61|nr:type IV secretion system DNA-binding domain-containing protein [Aggregatilinea lenta]
MDQTDQFDSAFVRDVQHLFESGDQTDALDLLDDYLQEHPHDVDAQLARVEFCLALKQHLDLIGSTLWGLREEASDDRTIRLRQQVEQLVAEEMAQGRRLHSRRTDEAIEHFDRVLSLAPGDASVALAAALALLDGQNSEDEDVYEALRRLRDDIDGDKQQETRRTSAIRFLERAMSASTPKSLVHTTAGQHLVRQYLQRENLEQALLILQALPEDAPQIAALRQSAAWEALVQALEIAVNLLGAPDLESAQRVLDRCLMAAERPEVRLFQAEVCRLAGDHPGALAGYRAMLTAPEDLPPDLSAAQAALGFARACHIQCMTCGKASPATCSSCALCGNEFDNADLLTTRYHLEDLPFDAIAHIGMAALLAEAGQVHDACAELDAVLPSIASGNDAAGALAALRSTWEAEFPPQPVHNTSALEIIDAWRADGPTDRILQRLLQSVSDAPESWAVVPFQTRRKLARQMMAAGYLEPLRQVLPALFADNPTRKTVAALYADLEAATRIAIEDYLEQARQALASDRPDQAIQHADRALAFDPAHIAGHVLRADARVAAGQDFLAVADYRWMLAASRSPDDVRHASLSATRVLMRHAEFEEALALLDGSEDGEAQRLRSQIRRRQRGEPALLLQPADALVMHDTLAKVPSEATQHGFFGVTVRAVRSPWNISQADWNERLLNAGFEFVQVLGGLGNSPGDPVFALRVICHPHPQIPERGRLTLAILGRVSAADPDICEALALNLWQTVRSMLPLVQEYIYDFEPVADEAELQALLVPFEPSTVAEIVRREDVPQHAGDRYAVYPFTPGSLDLHNLCWTLLRQPTPSMVSIHLLPTDLMPWERATLDQIMLGEPTRLAQWRADAEPASVVDTISLWWQGTSLWSQAQANRRLADTLHAHAYVTTVSVAGSAGCSSVLPEIVASTLFGPVHTTGETSYGGCEVVRANRDEELALARANLDTLDVAAWVYTSAPEGGRRLRHLLGESEAAALFRLPIPGAHGVPGVPYMHVKPIAPPAHLPASGSVWGESAARVGSTRLKIAQSADDRRRHAYVVGKTGAGKSTLLKNLALQDIDAGHGVGVVDPHGDLIDEILVRIPEHRVEDVILFDPSDAERPIGLNLMEARSEAERHQIVNEFIGLLVRMYDPHQTGIVGPRFQHNVRNAMLTAMASDESTLIETVRALTDTHYVRKLMPRITDPIIRNYWEKQIANTSDFHKSEILDYIVSKFSRFVGDRLVRNIIGQRHTTIDFRQLMDERKILLVNLSKGRIGPENAQFLGLLLVQRLLLTALSRADLPPEARPDFFLYVDEFQNFATDLFGTVLSEGRKYGVAVTVANQYLTQLDAPIREAIFGNVGSLVSFRVGTQDAALLAPEMYPVFGADDLLNLPKFTTCTKLLVDGVAARPFTMRTVLDMRAPSTERAARIRATSRECYGRDAKEVEADVMARFGSTL